MAERKKRKKTGRPPLKPGERRLPSMSFRPTHNLRGQLEQVSAESGKSLSQEIEYRLERSFADQASADQIIEAAFGGRFAFRLFQIFASAKSLIEENTGKDMKDDWETYQAVQHAWQHIAATFSPKRPDDWPSEPPTPSFEPSGLMGPVKFDVAYLEAFEAFRAPSVLGEAAAKVLLDDLAKAMRKAKQQTNKE